MAEVSYPDVLNDIKGHIPFQWDFDMLVAKTSFASGAESRRAMWQAPRRNVTINYTHRTLVEMQRIYNFFRDRNGSYGAFAFFFPQVQSYTKEYCGTYESGIGQLINLPSKGATPFIIYSNGTAVNYTFFSGGGPAGEDTAVIHPVLSPGDKIEYSFSGRLKIRCRFSENPIQINEVKNIFASFSVNLTGLRAKLV